MHRYHRGVGTGDLKPGDTVEVTLKFARGGEVRADAAVR